MSKHDDRRAEARRLAQDLPPSLRDSVLSLLDTANVVPASSESHPEASKVLPSSDAVLRAALSDTFTLADVAADERDRVLLLNASASVMVDGARLLRLTPDARAAVIEERRNTTEFKTLIQRQQRADQEGPPARGPESVWLRRFLAGDARGLDQASTQDLRAAVTARDALALTALPSSIPSQADMRRRLELAELLEPLRILIGVDAAAPSGTPGDRFVGRKDELRYLRAFVDELSSETAGEAITRGITRVARGVRQLATARALGVFVVEGRGGLGKSSLIAKFVLDHALAQDRPFPFAYLDFDRAVLQPRDPLMLLSETARQVALQYPRASDIVRALRQRIQDQRWDATAPGDLSRYFDDFRTLVRERITFRGARVFLLMLDTMEVVQNDQEALDGVTSFLELLVGHAFVELRVVAAGRADMPDLRVPTNTRERGTHHELTPLSVAEAKEMADRLGAALLRAEWKPKWATRIAGSARDPDVRREPLSVRVAVELLRSTPATDRDRLSQRIATEGEEADQSFVGVLYQRRVLEYVRDPEARRLAWPGLVLRRITRDIVRDLLAGLCDLRLDRVDAVFEALGREVWIVFRHGDALRHHPDVRSRTLPLMQRHNPALFDRINTAAIEYFARRAADDAVSFAEWLYHRLLGGEDPHVVDRDWTDDATARMGGAVDDFEHVVPRAASYILSRTATRLLPLKRVAALEPEFAYHHIARVAPRLGEFSESRCESVLVELGNRPAPRARLSGGAAAAQMAIDIKIGRWRVGVPTIGGIPPAWAQICMFAAKYKRARTIGTDAGAELDDELQEQVQTARTLLGVQSRRPPNAHRSLTQDLAVARMLRLPVADAVEGVLKSSWEWLATAEPADLEALRLAAAVCAQPREAMRRWLQARRERRLLAERAVSWAGIVAMTTGDRDHDAPILARLDTPMKRLRLPWPPDRKVRDSGGVAALRIVDDELNARIDDALEALVKNGDPASLNAVRRFAAVGDEDWVCPVGYAVARLMLPDLPMPVRRRLQAHRHPARSRQGGELPTDGIAVMRLADQASDLGGVAEAFLEVAPPSEAATDLRVLLQYRDLWKQKLREMDESSAQPSGTRARRAAVKPPEPGPVLHPDDVQKARWGGLPERNGRKLHAVLAEVRRDLFFVNLIVESTDSSVLEPPVVFHLHDSYPRAVIHIRRIHDGRWAALEEVSAVGVSTVGVQVKDASGEWMSLELDLATVPDLPKRFVNR